MAFDGVSYSLIGGVYRYLCDEIQDGDNLIVYWGYKGIEKIPIQINDNHSAHK